MSNDLSELLQLRDLVRRAMAEGEGNQFSDYKKMDEMYCEIAYRTPSFDRSNWKKGFQGLKNASECPYDHEVYDTEVVSDSFQEFDQQELKKLLLMIDRMNRFIDGFYDQQVENGVILKILTRLVRVSDY